MALYQRYRPLVFEDVIGQKEAVTVLESAVQQQRVPHALLFAGTHGTGKTTLARLVAAGLCCTADGNRPCGQCDGCQQVQQGHHPDVWELDAASNRGVDDARRLNDRLNHAPMVIDAHIVILDEAHMLTREAQNALLKTIEEPPTPVHIMMCTTELHKLLPTIRSRCQRYALNHPGEDDIAVAVERVMIAENVTTDAQGISALSHIAHGSFRDALSLAEQVVGGYGELTEQAVRASLSIPDGDMLNEVIKAWQSKTVDTLDKTMQVLQQDGVNWTLLTNELAHEVGRRLLKGEDPAMIAIIEACDKTLQSSLPFPLSLQYQLMNTWSIPISQASPIADDVQSIPQAAPTPQYSSSTPIIGEWSSARIAVMLPLIAIAARSQEPSVYLALRTAQATARGKKLILFSREYAEAPETLAGWLERWGPIDVEWKAGKIRKASPPEAEPAQTVEQVIQQPQPHTPTPRKASNNNTNDIDATLADLGILAVDE